MNKFALERKTLSELVVSIQSGSIKLPDFQRDFVWKPSQIMKFFDSISKMHPSGSLLFLEVNPEKPLFSFTNIKSVSNDNVTSPNYLILDGQQRVTSLHLAFVNSNINKKSYFIDILKLKEELIDKNRSVENLDLVGDKILVSKPFIEKPQTHLHESNLLPISSILDFNDPENSQDHIYKMIYGYTQQLRHNNEAKYEALNEFLNTSFKSFLNSFLGYEFPVVVLSKNLSVSGVCNIFQTINTTGLKLTAFDICVATMTPHGKNLKIDLETAKEDNPKIVPILESDPTIVLQTIALLENISPKKIKLPDNLKIHHYTNSWKKAINAINICVELLDEFGVGLSKGVDLLPYQPIVPIISSVLNFVDFENSTHVRKVEIKNKLKKWFFAVSLKLRFSEGTDNKMLEDSRNLVAWIRYGEDIDYLDETIYWSKDIIKNSRKNGAIGKAILTLINYNSPRDFYDGQRVGFGSIVTLDCQQHHIFPKRRYSDSLGDDKINSVFNFTFLSTLSNQNIKDKGTSDYLGNIMNSNARVTEAELRDRLLSHMINNESFDALMREDYDSFLKNRVEYIGGVLRDRINLNLTYDENQNTKQAALEIDIDSNY